eukprot:CAMPEP_0197040418 /NCGR_PEP_ID=MMETSP1384-20130603/17112_1 /TAXON_ID=29189 /ORGANISM="Ammonia sp." /LENGTH=682 /DNA_ID=CAMNT_0042471167 /DNA_START=314 /DNA_END=2362 /DNA_ORIENTATION=-
MADESYRVGPAESARSYLNQDKIIEIAKRSKAEAIHPGYGFLSENPDFVDKCDANRIIFIGPPADSMRNMGLKSKAKQLMDDANVPTTPGYHGIGDQSLETFKKKAKEIGYPIMLKAIAGGGGKGIRPVLKEANLEHEFVQCRNEAQSFFSNGDLLIEKYIPSARHIEFQIFTDRHGNGVHLFERDCSVQRGNQKVFEESPAPGLSWDLRRAMGQSAVDAALAVNYVGAGTVEFLVDPTTMDYWFMEMNTRLQVEHPVTEMIVARDLVQWQLHVAAGHELPCKQDDIVLNGHAIEARIYAEEYNRTLQRFTASSGTLHHLRFPTVRHDGMSNVRVESGVYEEGQVSTHYDAMIAKLITHVDGNQDAENVQARHDALKLMSDCLEEFQVSGLQTNIEFLKRVLKHPAFVQGGVTTDFIPTYKEDLFQLASADGSRSSQQKKATVLASIAYLLYFNQNINDSALIGYTTNGTINGSNGGEHINLYDIKDENVCYNVFVRRGETDSFTVQMLDADQKEKKGEEVYVVKDVWLDMEEKKKFYVQLSDEYIECDVSFFDNKVTIFYGGTRFDYVHTKAISLQFAPEFTKGKGGIIIADIADEDSPVVHHKSPMQAQVADLKVKVGDTVSKHQLLGNVISMKQYYEIWAQCDGVVSDIVVDIAESVTEGQTLIKIARQQDGTTVQLEN